MDERQPIFKAGINEAQEFSTKDSLLQNKMDNSDLDTSINTEIGDILESGYEFKVTPYRWVICVLFTGNFLARSIAAVGFASCSKLLIDIYGITTIHTAMLNVPFSIMVLIFLFPYNYICIHYGLRIPTYVSTIALVIGALLRLLVNDNFLWLIAGQSIMAIGQPLTLVTPAKIAALWFGDNQRALATTIGALAGPVGAVIGFVFPFGFLGDKDGVDSDEAREKVWNYILVQTIVVLVLGVPIFFFFKNKPDVAPSVSALKTLHMQPEPTMTSVKNLLTNKPYVMFVLCFSGIFSIYVCFGAIMGPLLDQFHFKPSANQYFGTAYVICGVVGSFVHATFLDKYKTYKKQIAIICILNLFSIGGFAATASLTIVPLTTLIIACLGASQLPIIGVGYQFCTELSYPTNENIAVGCLQFFTSFCGVLVTIITSYMISKEYTAAAVT